MSPIQVPISPSSTLAGVLALVFLLSATISGLIAVLGWRHRDSDGATTFVVYMGFSATISAICAIDVLVTSAAGSYLLLSVKTPLQIGMAVLWLVFALQFARRDRLVTRRTVAALSVVPAVTAVAVWTNSLHHLAYTDVAVTTARGVAVTTVSYGPVIAFVGLYSYLLTVAGVAVLVRLLFASRYVYRRQVVAILVGSAFPAAMGVVILTNTAPIPGLDVSPFGYAVNGAVVLWALSNYRLFDLSPIARDVLVEETRDGMIVVDRDGDVVDANRAAGRLYDEPSANLVGQSLSSLLPSIGATGPIEETERGTTDVAIHRDDETRHFEAHVTPLIAGGDRTDGLLVVLHDVTERIRRANELERQRAELRRQNDRLDRFASMVSHDLRNPLNVARGYLDLVDERDGDPIEEVDRALERMDRMVTELLALARAGATIDEDSIEPVALESVVDEAWRTVDTRGVALERPHDAVVSADRERLRHVFENLFRNAIDHADPTTVRVGYDPGTETVFVEDDGPGIPPEHRSSVFDRGVTSAEDGSGLGLAIASAIVEAHGWSIAVAEGRAGGARFELSNVVALEGPKPGIGSAEDSTPRADRRP